MLENDFFKENYLNTQNLHTIFNFIILKINKLLFSYCIDFKMAQPTSTQNVVMLPTIRKFSEDTKLRPFLSSHFDSQSYIKVSSFKKLNELVNICFIDCY